jgi:hypothetical protein
MARYGPIPKRSDQRRRTNKPKPSQEIVTLQAARVVEIPDADPSWHPVARNLSMSR